MANRASRAAVFIDRDGTINVEKHYLYRYEDWRWIPGAVEAIRRLKGEGFFVVVISNQAGVARGLYAEADVRLLHEKINGELAAQGAAIDAFYYCPHHPEQGERVTCDCRKPAPGLIFRAQRDWEIDLSGSFMIGDKADDVRAGIAAGVTPILVSTGYGAAQRELVDPGICCVDDLLAAANVVCGSVRCRELSRRL